MNNLVEVVENQSKIISAQSQVINDLFCMLSQYMAAEELDTLPQVARVNEIAELAAEIQ